MYYDYEITTIFKLDSQTCLSFMGQTSRFFFFFFFSTHGLCFSGKTNYKWFTYSCLSVLSYKQCGEKLCTSLFHIFSFVQKIKWANNPTVGGYEAIKTYQLLQLQIILLFLSQLESPTSCSSMKDRNMSTEISSHGMSQNTIFTYS